MRSLLLPFLLLSASTPLAAQWRVAVLTGSATSHGDARNDTDPAHPEFHADQPASTAIAVAREAGPWRVAIEGRRSIANLSEVGRSAVMVSTLGAFEAWGAGVELGRRIAGRPATASLRVTLGFGADRWSLDLSAARWRVSGRGALEADFPISGRWSAVVRGEATAGPSVFIATELPEGFARHTMWRTGVALGVARSWR